MSLAFEGSKTETFLSPASSAVYETVNSFSAIAKKRLRDILFETGLAQGGRRLYVYALDADTGKELWCNGSSGNSEVVISISCQRLLAIYLESCIISHGPSELQPELQIVVM